MKPHERREQIEAIVRREGEAAVDRLAARFAVSAETIRRDLGALAARGRVQKVHGGACRPLLVAEPSHSAREVAHAAEKAAIGRRLAAGVRPGETLFIDTGSTTLAAALPLAAIPGLTVITNSCRFAERLAAAGSDAAIHLLGGRYGADNAQTTGPLTVAEIARFQADRAVITVAALDPALGAMDASLDEAEVARAMIAQAQVLTVLADASKFGRRAAYTVCVTDEIDCIVTDGGLDRAQRRALAERGVEVWI
jgi:DeoR family glycerol-3-phosphate regulon repressor